MRVARCTRRRLAQAISAVHRATPSDLVTKLARDRFAPEKTRSVLVPETMVSPHLARGSVVAAARERVRASSGETSEMVPIPNSDRTRPLWRHRYLIWLAPFRTDLKTRLSKTPWKGKSTRSAPPQPISKCPAFADPGTNRACRQARFHARVWRTRRNMPQVRLGSSQSRPRAADK